MSLLDDLAARFAAQVDPFPTPYDVQRLTTPGALNPPHLQRIDQAWLDLDAGRINRLIVSIAPQEGKSERGRAAVSWWLRRHRDDRVVIASFEKETATRWGRAVRNDATTHPQLGLSVRADSAAAGRWDLDGSLGGIYCVGVGGAITGRPADLVLIDDPVKGRASVESELYRDRQWEWWQNDVQTRLGAGSVVVIVMTRWHEDDLAGRLLASEPEAWTVINIPALAENDDPLGRAPGEPLVSVRGKTRAWYERIRDKVGGYVFNSLYQGRPTPPEGGILPRGKWQTWTVPWTREDPQGRHWLVQDGLLYQSWDLAFKGTADSDFVVGQVWLRIGPDDYLLDQVRGRMAFPETVTAVRELARRYPETSAILVEDKANGPAVMATLTGEIRGILPVEPRGGKTARAHAISPYLHSGHLWLPHADLAPWVDDFLTEAAEFPHGRHDDQVDAMTQAVSWLPEFEEIVEDDTRVSAGPNV